MKKLKEIALWVSLAVAVVIAYAAAVCRGEEGEQ